MKSIKFSGQKNVSSKLEGEHMIAWIEKKLSADIDNIKSDLKDLAQKIGFEITRIEVDEPPFYGRKNELVKVYTNSYPHIPETEATKAREWLTGITSWSGYIIDADVKIEGSNGKDKTKLLEEVRMKQ